MTISFFQKTLHKMVRQLKIWNGAVKFNQLSSLAQGRSIMLAAGFLAAFALIIIRLTDLMICNQRSICQNLTPFIPRADIIDRNGCILATHLVTASVYANTNLIPDSTLAAYRLHDVFPHKTVEFFQKKLNSGKSFVWIARHLSPSKQDAVQRLGIPGVFLKKDYKRVYPYSTLACHVIGLCDIDGTGISGIEKQFNNVLWQSNTPLRLSLDIRVQHVLQKLLNQAIQEFHAKEGNAIVMKVKTGEIIAMESYPYFDLNHPADQKNLFNRNTLGVNEPGSVLKILNVAIALESGQASLTSSFDATVPIRIGRFTITDFKGKNRSLNLREAFLYSSNIASVKIMQRFGGADIQKAYFENFGLFDPGQIELPEIGKPLFPKKWTHATAVSSSYGYGIAITPLRLLTIVNGIINHGLLQEPTLLYNHHSYPRKILSDKTSKIVKALMRDVVQNGTGRKAEVAGYSVFGKTGTAYKNKEGSYQGQNPSSRPRVTTIVCGFPFHDPQYILIFMLDDPKATKQTFGYATAGWNVTPYAAKVIERIAPLLNVTPHDNETEEPQELWEAPLAESQPAKPKSNNLPFLSKDINSFLKISRQKA